MKPLRVKSILLHQDEPRTILDLPGQEFIPGLEPEQQPTQTELFDNTPDHKETTTSWKSTS